MSRLASLFLLAIALLALCCAAHANTLAVTAGGDSGTGTLRQALLDAIDGDSIVFAAGVNTVTLTSGELDVTKSVTIAGAASPYTIIRRDSGASMFRLFKVGPGASAGSPATITLQNLDLENGNQSGNAGGAIYVDEHTQLIVDHCTMNGNHADSFGGAVNITGTSALTMSACTLSNNTAGNWGGAISIPYGGGASIDGSTFYQNSSSDGGAILVQSWVSNDDGLPGNVVFSLTNSTFVGNSDPTYASAIDAVRNGDRSGSDSAPVTVTVNLTNVTIADNAASPNAVRTYNSGPGGSISLVTTGSVYSNPLDANNLSGQEITGAYNLLADGGSNAPNLTKSILDTDPRLGALADNGGPTQTMLPAYASAAVDAQPPADCTVTTDQRGAPRPQNHACDLGAVELDRIFAAGFDPLTVYATDFEICPSDWTLTGDWQCGTPQNVGPATAFAGTNCLGTQIATNYNDSDTWALTTATSPAIDLTGVTNPMAIFRMWVDTEGSTFDGADLMISIDGGTTYSVVTSVIPSYPLMIAGKPAWGGHQAALGWQAVQADLSAYAGNIVRLRFAFQSDSSGSFPGFYVDNFSIQ
ncbi:MAG: choice-of-anchor Q domain-containing protein [Rudaea sp.]